LVAIQGEQTAESFIEHLPIAMRNNYVLVFQRRSIQEASRAETIDRFERRAVAARFRSERLDAAPA
jgi:hypothetical protein